MRLRLPTIVPALATTALLGAGALAAAHNVDNRPAPKVVVSNSPAAIANTSAITSHDARDVDNGADGRDLIDDDSPAVSPSVSGRGGHDPVDSAHPTASPSPSPSRSGRDPIDVDNERPSATPSPTTRAGHDSVDNDNDGPDPSSSSRDDHGGDDSANHDGQGHH